MTAGVVEQRARLAEQIESDVRERDVFFDLWGARSPLRQPLRQDQRVVTKPQRVGEQRWRHRVDGTLAHICRTSSGKS